MALEKFDPYPTKFSLSIFFIYAFNWADPLSIFERY